MKTNRQSFHAAAVFGLTIALTMTSAHAADTLITSDFEGSLGAWTAGGGSTLYTYASGTNYATTGTGAANLPKVTGTITLTDALPLSTLGYTSVEITFNYKWLSGSTTRRLYVQYAPDGVTFGNLAYVTSGNQGSQPASVTLNVGASAANRVTVTNMTEDSTGYAGALFTDTGKFRFIDTASASADVRAYVDDIVITATPNYTPPSPSYWDLNDTTAGAGGAAPNGAWSGTNWNAVDDGTGSTAAWTAGATAVFAAGTDATGAYAVTVDGTQDIGGLNFEEGTVTLSGGTALRMTKNSSADVASGLTATVATPLTENITGRQLLKTGSGTLVLSGANTYSGGTAINQGTLQLDTGGTLGGTSGALTMGSGSAATLGAVGNLTLNEDVTVGAFSVQSNTATIVGADIGLLTIASGKTLTTGTLTFGLASGTTLGEDTKTALGTAGGGSLIVNGALNLSRTGNQSPQTTVTTLLDLSGLVNFTNNNSAGTTTLGANTQSYPTLTLASTSNLINASTLNIGTSTGNYQLGESILNLGAGTNTLQADTIVIGQGKGVGTIQFAGSTGSVTIAGTDGSGTAAITIGKATSASYNPGPRTDDLLMAGHSATVSAANVVVAQNAGNSGGAPIANVTFDTGTFDATAITLAGNTSGNSAGGNTGTFTVGGPTANTAATGVVNVTNDFVLAANTNSAATATGTVNGSLVINGGTVNINTAASATGGIFDTTTSTTGNSATTLTLAGGTLDLNGGAIGGTSGTGKKNITNLNFQSGTLQNVAEINDGAGLTKTTAGTLVLGGTNTYTGDTTVNEGTLSIGAANTANDASTVTIAATGATLDLTYSGTDTVDKLFIGTTQMAQGTYGPTATSIPQITNSSGNGTLTVMTGPAGGYAAWTTGPFLGTLSNTDASVDFDNGGLTTGIEWAVGGDPTDGSDDAGNAPTVSEDGTYLVFTYNRRDTANDDANTAIVVEYGSDLTGWTPAANAVAGVIINETPGSPSDVVEVKIPKSLEVGSKLFARLNVVVSP